MTAVVSILYSRGHFATLVGLTATLLLAHALTTVSPRPRPVYPPASHAVTAPCAITPLGDSACGP